MVIVGVGTWHMWVDVATIGWPEKVVKTVLTESATFHKTVFIFKVLHSLIPLIIVIIKPKYSLSSYNSLLLLLLLLLCPLLLLYLTFFIQDYSLLLCPKVNKITRSDVFFTLHRITLIIIVHSWYWILRIGSFTTDCLIHCVVLLSILL